jgi:ElaB/YqjD/DUF883 family membrane-anchored ribosome-binding protein
VGNESPELIERQMEETRESLTEKVALLEQQVTGTIQSATEAVQDTVQTVKSAVEGTVEAVKGTVQQSVASVSEGMKEVLDVRKHVQENPWAMVGGAAAAGFVTGLLVFGRRPSNPRPAIPFTSQPAAAPAYAPAAPAYAPAVSHRPGWVSDLFELVGREVKKLAESVIATASASLKETVGHRVPELIDSALKPSTPCERADAGTTGAHANGPSATFGTGGMRGGGI